MSFGDHLEELRRRILLSLAAPLPLAIVLFFLSDWLIRWLAGPVMWALRGQNMPTTLQALGPAETLGMKLKISIIAALILSGPWIIWQAWSFIRPGLYPHERRFVYLLIPGSGVLTVCGVVLMQYAMLPLMLWVLIGVGKGLDLGEPGPRLPVEAQIALEEASEVSLVTTEPVDPQAGDVWLTWPDFDRLSVAYDDAAGGVSVSEVPRGRSMITQEFRLSFYINFVLLLHLAIVIAFQMPLVIMLLGWLGMVSADWLRDNRKYALLICAVISAVITPADVVSQLMMLLPLYGLYELGILLLVFAPAQRVAEGRIFSLTPSNKSVARDDQSRQSEQSARPGGESGRTPEDGDESTDDEGNRR